MRTTPCLLMLLVAFSQFHCVLSSCRTTFGKEYEVTAHTFLDCHKLEEENNHWVLSTSDPAGNGLVLLNRQQWCRPYQNMLNKGISSVLIPDFLYLLSNWSIYGYIIHSIVEKCCTIMTIKMPVQMRKMKWMHQNGHLLL